MFSGPCNRGGEQDSDKKLAKIRRCAPLVMDSLSPCLVAGKTGHPPPTPFSLSLSLSPSFFLFLSLLFSFSFFPFSLSHLPFPLPLSICLPACLPVCLSCVPACLSSYLSIFRTSTYSHLSKKKKIRRNENEKRKSLPPFSASGCSSISF